MKYLRFVVCIFCLFGLSRAYAEDGSGLVSKQQIEAFDVIDWKVAIERMKKLSQFGYHPFLMPLIMENSDFIELSKDQIKTFKKWRDKNRVPLLHAMNKIIYERNKFQKISLNPHTSEEVLRTKQEEIFKLHKKVLEYQLSCRRNILDTFTEEQWDNFRFVLNENGYEVDL
jgi:hypothetical protein